MSTPQEDQSGIPRGPVKESGSKIFKDPVHGTITVTGLCVKIIDTPQFQRLRYLKQLGGGYFVYPGAAHNRFEHSIGTYYLAGTFARILQQEYPDLKDDEITCIEIAGLCHDLGHGPFSHVFDNLFIPRVVPGSEWKHEHASVDMLDHLINTNEDVKEAFKKFDENGTRGHLELIKDLILGRKNSAGEPKGGVHEMRGEKPFLYEIVNNAETGIDVDKWDYFARDCHMLGIKNNFDHDRYMKLARIIFVEEEGGKVPRICARDKEAYNLYDMFHTRETLHRRAYQHQVTRGVELMIVDALRLADETVRITGSNGKQQKISECINDMAAYSHLNDSILQFVEDPINLGTENDSHTLEQARTIIRRLRTRDLYKCVGQYTLSAADPFTQDDIPGIREKICSPTMATWDDKQFEIVLTSFDYGKKKDDPLTKAWFYRKFEPAKAFTLPADEISRMLPKRFQERGISIYSKQKEFEVEIARRFKRWSDERKMEEFPENSGQQVQMPGVSNQ
ncbi:deoxynucleoside triphosphate triphosphohydrolase SAMHD1-like isoform X2 [Haliotis rufescens]|uniref:deoxynucleoside triphosphate triphosphohydrolase SAMHD1-like isoform X2 n=1 Tax=Haliotis rufescens TaxID=6454 RepID=UPI00201F7C95|nr:deoxynucleoside triphosphate triphosphohydrolase SAMHD1-like isoform X2 [Haliotis rufescens]